MKLSVIVPVYNVEKFLTRCLESIALQMNGDYELILIDDGSTDTSGRMCDDFAHKHPNLNVVVLHQPNGGLSVARNRGIEIAQGAYITFVDSDDYIAPCTIEKNMEILAFHPEVDILEFPVEVYAESAKAYHLDFCDEVVRNNIFSDWIRREGYKHSYAWNKIYRADIWKETRFAAGRYFEDGDVMPLIVRKCHCMYYSSVGCYHYLFHSGSITTSHKYVKQRQLFENNHRLYLMIKEHADLESESLRLWMCCLNQFVDMGRCKDVDMGEYHCLMGEFGKESPSYGALLKMAVKEGEYKLFPLPILGLKNYLRCYVALASRL